MREWSSSQCVHAWKVMFAFGNACHNVMHIDDSGPNAVYVSTIKT